jgi:SAM-dependent methyltransferase
MPEISKDILNRTDDSLRSRYSSRLEQFGEDARTLGWDTDEHQQLRFSLASTCQPTCGKSVMDIGCGFSDLFRYLSNDPERAPRRYIGVDINSDLLDVGARNFPDETFIQGNILTDQNFPKADVAFMLGVLNFRFTEISNIEFSKAMISRAFDLTRDALVVDMLSLCRDQSYPEEDFVYYYDPSEMLSFALSITPHVEIRHDYGSIPQREMMLVLRHSPWT